MSKIKLFSEIVFVSALISYIVLVLQELMSILNQVKTPEDLVVIMDLTLWAMFGIACLKYFVLIMVGLFTKALKAIMSKDTDKANATVNELTKAYLELQQKAIASGDAILVQAAKNTALNLIGTGVDLFHVADNLQVPATPVVNAAPEPDEIPPV